MNKNITYVRALSALLMLSLLLGCASAGPSATRYILPPDASGNDVARADSTADADTLPNSSPNTNANTNANANANANANTNANANADVDSPVVIVQPLRLAGYLEDSAGIVLQLDDITLNQAANHRWAEDLGAQLRRGLRQRLAGRLPDTRVLDDGAVARDTLQLRVDVERFHGLPSGRAIASGQWQLRGSQGSVVAQESFNVETRLEQDGYPALVRALGRAWDLVADEIARGIAEIGN